MALDTSLFLLGLNVNAAAAVALTPVNVTVIVGQSLTTWARDDIAEITAADRPSLSPANTKIWDVASQTIAALKYGPIAGGGNEQQPGNSWLDAAYQSGIGWLWGYFDEVRVDSPSTEEYVFGHTIGGSMYVSTGAFGVDGNWTPTTTGSAYQDMLVQWTAFKAALAAAGKTPSVVLAFTDLGVSSASDASAATFQTNHTAMIAQLRTDVIGNALVYQHRISSKYSARTSYATIRTAHQNMAIADPTKFKLINSDGMALEFTPNAAVDDHPVAGSLEMYGRQLGLNRGGILHPLKEFSALSDPIYPLRVWEPGSLETFNSGTTPWSDYALHAVDRCGTADMVAVNAGENPALEKTTLSSGLIRRAIVFDGVNDYLRSGIPSAINNSGGFILCGAFKMAAATNRDLYCESKASSSTPFWGIKSDASGHLCVTLRDDGNTVRLSLADLGAGTPFDGTWHFIAVTYDGANTFTGYVDGTTGTTPQTYAKTAITLDIASFGADFLAGTASGFSPLTMGGATIAQYSATGLAAYIAGKRAYYQRKYGTP